MKNKTSKPVSRLILCAFMLFISHTMEAQCFVGPGGVTTSQAESDLWAYYNCQWDFVLWQYQAYRMHDDDWGSWGFHDACNINMPYPKCVNASFLLEYGLLEDLSTQWHGTIDYGNAAEAWPSSTHDGFYYEPSTSRSFIAQTEYAWLVTENTKLGCLLFDFGSFNNNPASRAGDYVHEAWHHWQIKYDYSADHMQGPIGACTLNSSSCDWFYFHGVGDFAFGEMYKSTSDGIFFHSPNQAQVEFLCDIAEVSQPWLPASVRIAARADANQRLASRFRNLVAFRCGDPRPW